ncbi:MAG: DUF1415 domain-containing protein [Ramlibacter sp.]|jgi:hypothetical protein|uniref:DUF1415 domain-containing protein n=1 Tax=Ramlibacter sp. TaxID=1917967 RepID=UPI002638CC2A|nr:DUF1415 domain-containing protein [Ramlibacter sp.]MDH4375457.1 DUF1415 domain-containing protein [Ramlibacter sp.]
MENHGEDLVVSRTRRWLTHAVVGLNLCPFAKAVMAKGQVHYAVTPATGWSDLLAALEQEVDGLMACAPELRDTSLLIAPQALPDFFEFNGFIGEAERLLARRELEGVLQLAHFHPQFEFAGADPDDIAHFTNRSPYPTLHLLRADSITRAVQAFPDASAIYDTNIATLRRMGRVGWAQKMKEWA